MGADRETFHTNELSPDRSETTAVPMRIKKSKTFSVLAGLACCISIGSGVPVNALNPADTTAGPIVVQNYYYALPGKADEVYQWRLHASEVRAKLGLRIGRVLRRIDQQASTKDLPTLPDVVWECDYPSQAARQKDVERLGRSSEFDEVERHMDTLLRKFDRVVFEPAN